jgi:hypothetical protein
LFWHAAWVALPNQSTCVRAVHIVHRDPEPAVELTTIENPAKPETLLTVRKPLQSGPDLRDEDIEILTIKVRVPSSALLENISIAKGRTDFDSGLTLGDNDSTDPASLDITDTI